MMNRLHTLRDLLPKPMRRKLLSVPFFGRLREKQVMIIPEGAGKGLKFSAGPSNTSYMLGTNERPVQELLTELIKPGYIFYDIGANVGFFTVIGARLVGNQGRVVAFEPVPRNLTVLRRNVGLNRFLNVTIIPKAVSNRSGQGELILTEHSGGATLSTTMELLDRTSTTIVDLISIDNLLAGGEVPPPSIIKIDVEGAELEVISGMSTTLGTYHPSILLELDDGNEAALSDRKNACQSFLQSFGYSFTQIPDSYPGISWKVEHFIAVADSQ